MTVNKSFFDDLLRDKRLSLRELARRLEILPSQLSLTLNGKRRMQIPEAIKIAQLLGTTLNEVMVNAGIEEARRDRRRCDVVGHLTGDGHIEPSDLKSTDRTVAPDGIPGNCEAIQARTAETPLSWMDGWVFFCTERQNPEELIGHFCRVKISDGPEVLATIGRGYDIGTYSLYGPFAKSSKRIEWAMPVVLTRH